MGAPLKLQRYLLHFSYQGTRFAGLQKQIPRPLMAPLTFEQADSVYAADQGSVQGALEASLWQVARPLNKLVVLQSSSRTDTGVHALCNTAHVDLAPSARTLQYMSPRNITCAINQVLAESKREVRVTKTVAVPPQFHSRCQIAFRSYLYRLAVLPHAEEIEPSAMFHPPIFSFDSHKSSRREKRRAMLKLRRKETATPTFSQMSQFDQGKYTLVRQAEAGSEFSVQLFREALAKMEGRHNFSSFVKSKGLKKYWKEGGVYNSQPRTAEELTKTIFSIKVEETPPPISSSVYPPYSQIKFLDVTVRGQSFLHNQIRRMVGVAVAIAMGKVDLGLVDRLLNQSEWDPVCSPCSPDGLYLAQVHS